MAGGFELQGHRGARGLAPENTLAGFSRALAIGVHRLELDTGVTRDGVVVISHDSVLNPDITRGPDGAWLEGTGPPIRSLAFAELARYDVGRIRPGSAYARRFPDQVPVDGEHIPALAELLALVARSGNEAVGFNVETKLSPESPALAPAPAAFADALVAVLREGGVAERAVVQSFDWRSLQRVQAAAPEIATSYLTAEQSWLDNVQRTGDGPSPWTAGLDLGAHGGSLPRLVNAAGGRIWSPFHGDLDAEQLAEAHALGLRVVVWTVNDAGRMRELIDLGVDGIITDYPDRLRTVMAAAGLALPDPVPAPRAASRTRPPPTTR